MARELLLGDIEHPTKQSDIWALACVCYEVFKYYIVIAADFLTS
jgi:serine/threonine protein kinase